MKFKVTIKKENVVAIIKYLLMFCLYFLVHYRFLGDLWFGSDELDVMCGGKNIASGHLLYGDFYSQHMPFSYYLSALFDFLGAKTVPMQRISFYAFYAFMWTIINIRYKDIVNKVALFLYPLLFSSIICCYDMGTVVLSEHLAGIGFVILYLEFLSFLKKRELNVWNCIFISLSVVLTFGTVFIGAFGVFVIAVAVFIKEIMWRAEAKEKFQQMFEGIVKKFWMLVAIVAAPWVVLFGSFIIQGNIGEFFMQAYVLNRVVYSKYTDGYGSSIFSAILGTVDKTAANFWGLLDFANMTTTTMMYLIVYILVATYLVRVFDKKDVFLGVTTILYLMAVGIRGTFNYHGTQWVAVASLLMALGVVEALRENKETLNKVVFALMVFAVLSRYWSTFSAVAIMSEKIEETGTYIQSVRVEAITEEDEAIWQLDFSNHIFMAADRPSICNVGATPWFWEAVGLETLERIEKDMPRVATYSEGLEVWGYKLVDYAPELVEFMDENYTQYENSEIYIRNDYYEEACEILEDVE